MQPIKKSNLVNEVYNQLLQMLASGEYGEGSKLPSETQLCEALGVSRNTVRTAISKLIALGIVENIQGFGNRVRSMNVGIYANSILPCLLTQSSDLVSVTEFRIGVESMAARLAALHATEDEIQRMKEACENATRHMDSWDVFAKYDMEFHRTIAEASKNPLFLRTSEMIESMYTVWLIGFQRNHGVERSNDFHTNIYRAIARHDAEEAGMYMRKHLEDVLDKVKQDVQLRETQGAAAGGGTKAAKSGL